MSEAATPAPLARRADMRLLPAALGAWAASGTLIGLAPDAPLAAVVAALWTAAAVTALGALRIRVLGLGSLALTAAALVAGVVALQAPLRTPEAFVEVAGGAPVPLVLVAEGAVVDGRLPVRAWLADDPAAGEAPVLVFLDAGAGAHEPRPGERLAVRAALLAVAPGEDVSFLAFAADEPRSLAEPPPILAAAAELRAGLGELSAALPGEGAGLLPGLAVGDTSRVDPMLATDLRTSSLSHLTAVSGANCAIVVGAVFVVAGAVGLRRAWRVAVSLVALAGFVVLVTPEPSVLRAAVMAAIVLLALALGRPARGVPALCLAVVVLLAIDPWLARSYGFALSALATAGLLLLAGPLARVLARVVPAPLALLIAVPVAAQLACQPVLLLLSPTLPLWGVPANLLAAPAAPIATVVGLLACLAAPVAPPLAGVLTAIAWLPASWIAAVAELFAALPGARMPWPPGAAGIVALVALSTLGLAAVLGRRGTRLRRAAAMLTLAGLVGAGGAVVTTRLVELASRPADWQYAMCDVGQGDATVIRSAGAVALVDTGPDPAPLSACLDDLGITAIDLLVLTHDDLDHVGGVDAVRGRVATALVGPVGDADGAMLREGLRASGARVVEATVGMTGVLGDLEWRALWPPPRGVEPGNAASIALAVTPGPGCVACLSALLLGDLGEESQARMLAASPVGAVDVLKVAHHGSGDFSAELYARASAAVGLIGVGADNGYGHPTPRALEVLAASGTATFRTDLDGLILVAPPAAAGAQPRVWTATSP